MAKFEASDFNPRRVGQLAAVVFACLVVIGTGLFYLNLYLGRTEISRRQFRPAAGGDQVLSGQFDSFETGALARTLDKNQRQVLENYGWVSREKRLVHIPIERAMEILAGEPHE